MAPRRYSMTRKQADAAATRQRILDATLKLHSERGIFGTSWSDIARAADVAVGTVYRYFPSLEELVPACGELLMQRTQPPQPEDISGILGEAQAPVERLQRVAEALFTFYARAGSALDADLRERQLPAVREWEDYLRSMVKGFVAEALRPSKIAGGAVAQVCFLFDVPGFNAMRIRGMSPETAAATATGMAASWLGLAVSEVAAGPNASKRPDNSK